MAYFLFRNPLRSAWLLPGAAVLVLTGCAVGPQAGGVYGGAPSQVVTGEQPAEPAGKVEYHVLAGEMAVQRGDRKKAAQEYVAALAYSDDPRLAKRAARVALFAGEPALAYRAAQAWTAAEPNSREAQQTAAQLALLSGEADSLAAHAQNIIKQNPDGVDAGFRELADLLSGDNDHTDIALEVMRQQVALHPDVAEAYYAQGLLALRYQHMELANKSVQRALALRPDWPDAALLRAGILVRQGKTDEATALVNSLRGSKDERADYYLSYARLLLDAEQTAAAADEFDRVLQIQPSNNDARYGLALLALSLNQAERAKAALLHLYKAGQRTNDAAFYLGSVADLQKNYALARKWYGRVKTGSHVFDARVRSARALYHGGDLAGARKVLAELRQDSPALAGQLYSAEAELLYDAKQYSQALGLYNQALQDDPYDSDLLYGRSLVYDHMGQYKQAEMDLRTVLEREPDNARALNALGYMLSNRGNDYDQALEYIRQALDARPDDPSIIDSMGWVQYRLGDLQKARKNLEKAYSLFPDPEVAAHLGEVLWTLGEQDKAKAIWSKALKDAPDSAVLQETVKRFKQ